MTRKILLLCAIAALLLVACGDAAGGDPTPSVTAVAYVPYSNDTMGVTLEHPATWITEASFSGLTIASSDEILQAESLGEIGAGGFVVVLPLELDVFNFQTGQQIAPDDPLGALNVYLALLENEGQRYQVVEPPRVATLNGQTGALMVVRSDEAGRPLLTTLAAIIDEGQIALISAAALEDAQEVVGPTLDRIVTSIDVRPAATGTR